MGEMDGIVSTHMIEKRWTVLEGSYQISLENMKAGVTTTKKLVKTALQARETNIIREARGVMGDIPINIHFEHVY